MNKVWPKKPFIILSGARFGNDRKHNKKGALQRSLTDN
jgi:hypothetical protein